MTLVISVKMKKILFQTIVKFLKGIVILFARFIFRIETRGVENIPKEGGALLIANHVSYLDNMVMVAAMPRDIGFIMARKVYDHPFLNWLLKRLPMVPIETGKSKEYLDQFNQDCQDKINNGGVVCIFAEGQISRNGHLLPFKKGLEYIGKGLNNEVTIIPMHIDGLIGTPLSYDNINKRTLKFKLSNFFKRVRVTIGSPLNSSSSAFTVRQEVKELEVANFARRIKSEMTLLSMVEKHMKSSGVLGKNWWKAQEFAKILKNRLQPYTVIGLSLKDEEYRQELNVACALLGKVVFNFREGEVTKEVKESIGIEIIIEETSFNKSGQLQLPAVHEIDSFLKKDNSINKQTDVVLFKAEKEVYSMSHENLIAYFFSLKQLFDFGEESIIYTQYGIDTAIGYFVRVWAPLLVNSSFVRLEERDKATVVVGDAEFVNDFEKNVGTKDLRTILLLDDTVNDLISEVNKEVVFQGLRSDSPCPILTLNSPDFEGKSLEGKTILQEGRSSNTFGRPLPGIAIKIVDNEGQSLSPLKTGKVMAKGVLFAKKGWIDTKQVGMLTEEGFLSI